MLGFVKRFVADEQGLETVEYAVAAALIAAASVIAFSTLGGTVTELMRIDLSQSPVINVLEPAQVGAVLDRMLRPSDTTLSPELATSMCPWSITMPY